MVVPFVTVFILVGRLRYGDPAAFEPGNDNSGAVGLPRGDPVLVLALILPFAPRPPGEPAAKSKSSCGVDPNLAGTTAPKKSCASSGGDVTRGGLCGSTDESTRGSVSSANAAGCDIERFDQDVRLHSSKVLHRVTDDAEDAEAMDLNATPTLFVNGARHKGPWDAKSLIRALEGGRDVGAGMS